MAAEHFHLSESAIRAISSVAALMYATGTKIFIEYNRWKKPVEEAVVNTVISLSLEERLKRISEFNEIIDLPEDSGLPDEVVTLITERNYYKLMMEKYRNDLTGYIGGTIPPLASPFELLGFNKKTSHPEVRTSEDKPETGEG